MSVVLLVAATIASADPATLGKDDEPRVRTAREQTAPAIKALFAAQNVPYPAHALLLRAFKLDDTLELWAQPTPDARYVLLKTYPICARSGGPGPKAREGDGQVPEGFYRISAFNPWSNFLLSMRVDYPNAADRQRSTAPKLGGDIFVHGSCVTIGCLPLGDDGISELYVIAQDTARRGGTVSAHLFPTRLDDERRPTLEKLAAGDAALLAFWDELRPGYAWFEARRTLPRMKIDGGGHYRFAGDPAQQSR